MVGRHNHLMSMRSLVSGERIHIYTPSTLTDFVFAWRTLYQQEYIVFQVEACSDCHVALSPTLGVDYVETYLDLVIGGWENTQSQIRKVIGSSTSTVLFSNYNCSLRPALW